jgi:predicted dehydrogenase
MSTFSRRKFLGDTSRIIAGAGLVAAPVAQAYSRSSANEKVGIGLIGANGMGWANLKEHLANPEVECIAIADVDQSVLDKRAADVAAIRGKKPLLFTDFRKLLENKDIDAVIIGTPDHWHCLNMVYACEAGKDVYVEKPLANSIHECNLMAAAAKRYNRVVQVGQWQRSGPHWQSAIAYIHSGKLGKISSVRNWIYNSGNRELAKIPDGAPPAGVDYNMWLGPAPARQFNKNRYHGSWRSYWDYGGGLMSDWGVHLLDMAFYGMKSVTPKSVVSHGGKYSYPDSDAQTPDNQNTIYGFDGYMITWEHVLGRSPGLYGNNYCGVAFQGTNGTLVVDREKWRLFPESEKGQYLVPAMPEQRGTNQDLALHVKNFLECIKSRGKTNCDVDTARNVAVKAHLGNIAMKTGRELQWDNTKNEFINDKEANEMIKPVYREPWKLPKIG